mmetsp:Transcript_86/g.221  ORF Transcript_86/g.221 Transcript_86/m.221 type:complete len:175 (-) Transcript_86:737-1261(-)
MVTAKGLGRLETFWLEINDQAAAMSTSSDTDMRDDVWANAQVADNKSERLIDWQVDVFTRLLKQIVARRNATNNVIKSSAASVTSVGDGLKWETEAGKTCLDEVQEIIALPEFDDSLANRDQEDPDSIELGQQITDQLHKFIGTVALMYRKNGFHNVSVAFWSWLLLFACLSHN